MLKLAEVGNVIHLNRVLYQYRRHEEMTTVKDNDIQNDNNYIVINQALQRIGIHNIQALPDGDIQNRVTKFLFKE